MANSNITPEHKPVTLKRAAQLLELDEQEVIDAAALGEIPAGIIAPSLKCHAIPTAPGGANIDICKGHYQGKEFEPTQMHVQPKNPDIPAQVAPVFVACGFWQIGGHAAGMTRSDASTEINFLWPHAGADLGEIVQFLPWGINGDESMVKLLEPYEITREDLRFLLPKTKADAFTEPANTADEYLQSWKNEARAHYQTLREQFPNLSKAQLSEKIAPLMQAKQRGGKPVTAENILRNALQNLE